MSTKVFSDAELELLHEGSHYPHMQHAMAPLVIVNQHDRTIWHPRRMDLALAKAGDEGAAVEGGKFREPVPARVHVNEEGPQNEGASWTETMAIVVGVPAGIFLIVLGVWVYRTWFA